MGFHASSAELNQKSFLRAVILAVLLNGLFVIVEIGFGIFSKSLALVSDAVHNLSDICTIIIAMLANRLSMKLPDAKTTFGYGNAENIAALLNSISLFVICFYISAEAAERLINSQNEVMGMVNFWVASFGVFINGIVCLLFYKVSKNNMNFKLVLLHSLTDALISLVVALSGLLIAFYGYHWIDSVISIMISSLVLWQVLKIFIFLLKYFMQRVPLGFNISQVKSQILSLSNKIKDVHHIHIWNVSPYRIALEAHIKMDGSISLAEAEEVKVLIKEYLYANTKVSHITLEMESGHCIEKDNSLCYET